MHRLFSTPLALSVALVGSALAGAPASAQPTTSPLLAAPAGVCPHQLSDGLRALSDAYLTGSDRVVLAAALRGQRAAAGCGDEVDAVSFELIAADAYGDVREPGQRCDALRDAARRATHFEGAVLVARAKRIRQAADVCQKV